MCNIFEADTQVFVHENQLHLFLINEFVSIKKKLVKRQEKRSINSKRTKNDRNSVKIELATESTLIDPLSLLSSVDRCVYVCMCVRVCV